MRVDVHTIQDFEDVQLGSILWDDDGFRVEPDVPRLRRLLDEPVYDAVAGEEVTTDDPKRFLELMPFQYRSPYFRVSPAEEKRKAARPVRKAIGEDESAWYGPFLDIPDNRQIGNYDCGAACTRSVSLYFGVDGGRGEEDFIRELDTLPTTIIENGTRWQRIVEWFQDHGIPAHGQADLTLEDLRRNWKAGVPTITLIQDYGSPEAYAANESGHYVVVCGFVGSDHLVIQDPSSANVVDYGLSGDLITLAKKFLSGNEK